MSPPAEHLLGVAAAAAATPDHALLEKILADPSFDRAGQPASTLSMILETLQALFDALLGSKGAAGTAEFIRLAFFVAVGVLVVWSLRKALRRLASTTPPVASATPRVIELDAPEHHEQRAQAAHAAGAYRKALRHQLLSALAALEGAGWVSSGRHRTNREFLYTLRQRGAPEAIATPFEQLIAAHDPWWYGRIEIGAAESNTSARLAAGVRQAAAAHPHAARGAFA